MNNVSLLRSAAVVAFLSAVLVPLTASARGEVGIDRETTANLTDLSSAMGTADGHVKVFDGRTGAEVVLASNGRAYVSGALIATNTRFDLCQETRGRLHSCLPFAPPPAGTGYECGAGPSGDTSCQCSGMLDCLDMVFAGACDSEISCDGNTCTCSF